MRFVYKTLLTSAAFVIFLTSCSSKQHDKAIPPPKILSYLNHLIPKLYWRMTQRTPIKGSIVLYCSCIEPRSFNGNVLVAKHGKIVY